MADEIKANCSNTTGFANTQKKKINIKTTAKREERKDNIKLNAIYPQKLLGAVGQLVHNCRVSMRSNFPSVEISFS